MENNDAYIIEAGYRGEKGLAWEEITKQPFSRWSTSVVVVHGHTTTTTSMTLLLQIINLPPSATTSSKPISSDDNFLNVLDLDSSSSSSMQEKKKQPRWGMGIRGIGIISVVGIIQFGFRLP